MKKLSFINKCTAVAAVGFLAISCGPDEVKNDIEAPKEDTTATTIDNPPVGKYDDAIFSIPSPIQMSSIIAENGASYDANMLNKANKSDIYVTAESQALNLGIYGADLGYTTLYDHQQEALKYMKASRKLADALGISEAFDEATIQQLERNLDNKDSLLYLVANTYRKTDEFLQVRDRKHVGALIIVGGWIESLYFATTIDNSANSKDVAELIGNQKHTLETILDKMLVKYTDNAEIEDLYTDLSSIRESFEEVNIEYTFAASVHNKESKTTELNSTTTVDISPEVFKNISDKIALLRKKIIK